MANKGEAREPGIGPYRSEDERPPHRPAQRARQIIKWGLVASCSVLVLVTLSAWLIAKNLNHPWLKPRILGWVKQSSGLDVDYSELELLFSSGIRARSLSVATPPALAVAAPHFLDVEGLEVRAKLWSFAFGGIELDALRVGAIELSIVEDATGKTSLSELFPDSGEGASEERTRLSQMLTELPELAVADLDLGALRARRVQLFVDRPARVTTLSGLALRGVVHSGARGLEGTELHAVGAPVLRLELADAGAPRYAELGLSGDVRGQDRDAVSLRLHLSLEQQDLLPHLARVPELLLLEARLHFDAASSQTSLSLGALRAWDGALSASLDARLFDADRPRALVSGQAKLQLIALPVPIEGVALDSLGLELSARELSWEAERISGAFTANGGLRELTWQSVGSSARVADATLRGEGQIQGAGGTFQLTLEAPILEARSGPTSVQLRAGKLELDGQAREAGPEQHLESKLRLGLASARLRGPEGSRLELENANFQAQTAGSPAALAALAIARLESSLRVAKITLRDANTHSVALQDVSATAHVDQLARAPQNELGVSGILHFAASVPSSQLVDPAGRWSMGTTELRADLPLSLSRASATLSLASLSAPEKSLRDLALELDLEAPLEWSPAGVGAARASLMARVAAFRVGESRGVLDELRLVAQKLERDRYQLELDGKGSSLAAMGIPVAGPIVTQVRADGTVGAGKLGLTTTLRGAAGAAVDLELDARFERPDQRLVYRAQLATEKLDAFAALLPDATQRGARGLRPGARLHATASGDFTGVLRSGAGALPTLTAAPLVSARGSQAFRVELLGLDYREPRGSIVVPALNIELESAHRANGAGRVSASVGVESLDLAFSGASMRLGKLEQKLVATFAQSPELGRMDVSSKLLLASASQSYVPGYQAKDLRLESEIEVDRLQSFFIRELLLDNPASGTQLRGAGTLERGALSTRAGADDTLIGREALQIDGRLTQQLPPLVEAGLASSASGRVEVPFRLESGGLLGYRLLAKLEAHEVAFANPDQSLVIEDLRGVIPVIEEFALLPSGLVLSGGPRASPLSETRFFDVHPFLAGDDYVTARSIRFRGETLGPLAANLRVDRTDFALDQLQAGYRGGQVVGQVRAAYRAGDPIVRLRLNVTGLRTKKSGGVLDANAALSFVPGALTLDGKVQVVRASREHLLEMLDVLDPFHEMMNANRVRRALGFGYPKFVRFALRDGAVDAKVELGGIASWVRIDEIKAIPLGPILQRYVAPLTSGWIETRSERAARVQDAELPATGGERREP
jgi:translocation and assembly module TamB